MLFFFMAGIFMYAGRKIGWALSKAGLYTALQSLIHKEDSQNVTSPIPAI